MRYVSQKTREERTQHSTDQTGYPQAPALFRQAAVCADVDCDP
jgi:hypothetical protein